MESADSIRADIALLHHFVGVDAPHFAAQQPALDVLLFGFDPAPGVAAFQQPRHHAGLELGQSRRIPRRIAIDGARIAFDDDGAGGRDHALMHPAFAALPVANLQPYVVFAEDFDRQSLVVIDELDGVFRARTGAQIDLADAQGCEARHVGLIVGAGRDRREKKNGKRDQRGLRSECQGPGAEHGLCSNPARKSGQVRIGRKSGLARRYQGLTRRARAMPPKIAVMATTSGRVRRSPRNTTEISTESGGTRNWNTATRLTPPLASAQNQAMKASSIGP